MAWHDAGAGLQLTAFTMSTERRSVAVENTRKSNDIGCPTVVRVRTLLMFMTGVFGAKRRHGMGHITDQQYRAAQASSK
jgi:hypothetical protein